jgi:WD40 repeat protein/tRNA A-37 threonylcarbamoyl transferase component Bud32
VDCDDVAFLLASEGRTWQGRDEQELLRHVADCEVCRQLRAEAIAEDFRWIVRVPEDALDDRDLLVLPTVDPVVFAGDHELARGGMGRILRVRDRRLGRDVALKEILDVGLRARFDREVAITAQLQHPAIVPIYEAGEWPGGSAFYTMRLVAGGTLADAIANASTLEQRLALIPHVVATTEALAYAHSRQIVHRDLKPGNVLVGEFRETVVIDWGLAKDLRGALDDPAASRPSISPHLTRVGSVIGTPGFMSPEQAAGDEVDARADVYALGAILYNVLAGHPPYWDGSEAPTPASLVEQATREPPTPLGKLAPRVPADLRAIVERAMARDLATRYANAGELADELRRFEAGQLLRSREYRTGELIARWVRRHRAIAVAAAVAVAVGVMAIVGITRSRGAEHAARRLAEHALAESQLEQARQLLLAGSPDQAAPLVTAALRQLPGDPIAHRLDALARRDAHRRLARVSGGAAAFSPDAQRLAVGREDGSIAVLAAATGSPLPTLPGPRGAIADLAFTRDGARLLVAAKTGAQLRDATTGAVIVELGHAATSEARFVGPDRVALATATALVLVGLDGKPIAQLPLVAPHGLAVSRDGSLILARIEARKVVVASTRDLTAVAELGTTSQIYDATFAPDGSILTAEADGGRRWSVAPQRELARFPSSVTLAWLDDSHLLADTSVIDLATSAVHTLARDRLVQCNAAIDAGHALTGGYDRQLDVWDLSRGAIPIISLEAAAAVSSIAVDATHRRAVSVGAISVGAGAVELWDVGALPAPTKLARVGGTIQTIVASADGRLAVRAHGATGDVTTLLGPNHEVLAQVDGWPIAFRPNADELVTDREGRLLVSSARDGKLVREIREAQPIYELAFDPTGARAAIATPDRVEIRDATTWDVITSFEAAADITALAFDDRGDLVTGHDDGAVRLWDARTGAPLGVMVGHTARVDNLEARGSTLVSGSWDDTTRRWALPSGEPLGIVNSSHQRRNQIATSPDGLWIASTDGGPLLSILDAEHGRAIERIPLSDGLETARFVDDDHVMVGTEQGDIELVSIAP